MHDILNIPLSRGIPSKQRSVLKIQILWCMVNQSEIIVSSTNDSVGLLRLMVNQTCF